MIYSIDNLKILPISEPGVFCYLVTNGSSSLLIDAGLSAFSGLLWRTIHPRISGSAPLPVLITHADPDHAGGLRYLRSRVLLNVSAPPLEKEAITAGQLSRPLRPHGLEKLVYPILGVFATTKPQIVDNLLLPGAAIPGLPGLQVLPTPGHTPGHCSFFFEDEGILFCGDSLVYAHGRLFASTGANNWDDELSNASFQKQKRLNPEWIFAGHFLLHSPAKELAWS
jgi:glyoxylase-like metal-dependent hydrolase (beta-lactamase superfamily II)